MDATFVTQLQALCSANGDASRRVALDTGSSNTFDASYFTNLKNGRGVLESDQRLWTDASTKTFVQRFLGVRGLSGLNFNVEFGKSMVKMSNVGVKTGTEGEIRKVCSSINWSCTLWLSIYLSEVKNRYYSVTSHLHRESVIMIQLIPKSKVWMEILMHGCLLNIDAPVLFIDW